MSGTSAPSARRPSAAVDERSLATYVRLSGSQQELCVAALMMASLSDASPMVRLEALRCVAALFLSPVHFASLRIVVRAHMDRRQVMMSVAEAAGADDAGDARTATPSGADEAQKLSSALSKLGFMGEVSCR
jgi:hypothetical protein